jgi:hypothetical protein
MPELEKDAATMDRLKSSLRRLRTFQTRLQLVDDAEERADELYDVASGLEWLVRDLSTASIPRRQLSGLYGLVEHLRTTPVQVLTEDEVDLVWFVLARELRALIRRCDHRRETGGWPHFEPSAWGTGAKRELAVSLEEAVGRQPRFDEPNVAGSAYHRWGR